MSVPWYALLMMAGVAGSALAFRRLAQRDVRLVVVYLFGLLGALAGAKLGFALAELPWLVGRPSLWIELLHGKTILGGLLGGYGGVELGKAVVGVRSTTGDLFAQIVPGGLAVGRIGCFLQGCCLGVACPEHPWALHDVDGAPRVPITAIEFAFHLSCAVVLAGLSRKGRLRGQLFHLYLMSYALFRIATEPLRVTPHYAWGASPYQMLAGLLFAFAAWRAWARRREQVTGIGTSPVAQS